MLRSPSRQLYIFCFLCKLRVPELYLIGWIYFRREIEWSATPVFPVPERLSQMARFLRANYPDKHKLLLPAVSWSELLVNIFLGASLHMLLHHLKLARSCLTRVCCNSTINCRRSTICKSTTSATTGRQLLGLASWVAGCLSDSTVFASKRFVCHPLLNSLILGASFLMVIKTTASKNAHTLPSKDCRDHSSPVVC